MTPKFGGPFKGRIVCKLGGLLSRVKYQGRNQSVNGTATLSCNAVVVGAQIKIRLDARRGGRWVPLVHTSRNRFRMGPVKRTTSSTAHLCRPGKPRQLRYRLRMSAKIVTYRGVAGSITKLSRGRRIRCNV